ncbi:alpha/beta fold hydrolase [Arthrobacter bambusae]|uniref:alpha/beta fold hydrolase n=1 Tax=Arthrobacter bambusae TaxID=1338426 RepID=UPI001F5097FE|nr:alpha/beta fold hydrolase [Arthrobacter bambusae]MCI0143030.1 alpha/beta fold hydrolase [Arthrobacter bambusae]
MLESVASNSRPFVLLHGGRHGGWCWGPVASRLRRRGFDVLTPTLTGLGDRSHLLDPSIGLDTHVQDLVATFEYEDLTDSILVAHSYGGVVASAAMEKIADRVRFMVYVDALIPRAGESVFDLVGPQRAAAIEENARNHGHGWTVPVSDASYYGITDPDIIAWVNSKLTPQPIKTYRDPVGSTERAWSHPGMFVECLPTRAEPFVLDRARDRSVRDEKFWYRTLEGTHEAPLTNPDGTLEILLEAARIADSL